MVLLPSAGFDAIASSLYEVMRNRRKKALARLSSACPLKASAVSAAAEAATRVIATEAATAA